MRAFAILSAFALPLLIGAQCADSTTTALCCFTSQDSTVDNLTQLGTLQNTTLPLDIPGSIGLLCSDLSDTCNSTLPEALCCSTLDPSGEGVYALGCSALQATAPSS